MIVRRNLEVLDLVQVQQSTTVGEIFIDIRPRVERRKARELATAGLPWISFTVPSRAELSFEKAFM